MDTNELAAIVISEARTQFGQGAAGFDYHVAAGDDNALRWLDNAIYDLANQHLPELVPGSGEVELQRRADNATALRERLAAELDAYTAHCKARKYTGWSQYSTGPIRYAD